MTVPTLESFAQEYPSNSKLSYKDLDVEIITGDAYDKFVSNNDKTSSTINQLKNKGYLVDNQISKVDDTYVITYHNISENVYGMVQLTSNIDSKFEIYLDEKGEVQNSAIYLEGYDTIYLKPKENNDVDVYTVGTRAYKMSDEALSKACNIAISLTGSGIGAIYAAVAGAVGGALAAAIVQIIVSGGFGYLSYYC